MLEDVAGVITARCVAAQHAVSVGFKSGQWITEVVEWSFSGSVTGIELLPSVSRSALDLQTVWYTHFQLTAPLAATRPNPDTLNPDQPDQPNQPNKLKAQVAGLYPGQELLFENTETGEVEVVRITSIDITSNGLQQVRWTRDTGSHAWRKGYTIIHGNIARTTHGKTVEESLGSSSGTEPFLRFALKNSPVTILPTGSGEPAIEVRVGDILWERVDDFWASDADDRHYLVEHDHEGTTWIVFGDGRRGAIPLAGKKNIACTYRIGLGTRG